MLLTIGASAFENVAPGAYPAAFVGLKNVETKNGKAWRWEFKTKDGKMISGLSDAEKPPTIANKTGRWLCALAKRPIGAGEVQTDHFTGNDYMVIVVADKNGGGKLETFTAL